MAGVHAVWAGGGHALVATTSQLTPSSSSPCLAKAHSHPPTCTHSAPAHPAGPQQPAAPAPCSQGTCSTPGTAPPPPSSSAQRAQRRSGARALERRRATAAVIRTRGPHACQVHTHRHTCKKCTKQALTCSRHFISLAASSARAREGSSGSSAMALPLSAGAGSSRMAGEERGRPFEPLEAGVQVCRFAGLVAAPPHPIATHSTCSAHSAACPAGAAHP